MNLEDTIYFGCAAYSSIHPNRAAELNHLFLVYGNGYDWVDGELVETCGETTTKSGKRLSLSAAINKVFRQRRVRDEWKKREERNWKRRAKHNPDPALETKLDKLVENAVAAQKAAKEKDPVRYAQVTAEHAKEWAATRKKWREEKRWEYRIPDDIKKRVKDTTGYNHWYPMCERYSYLLNFPDDIKPDWLDGVIETCMLVIANPPVPYKRPGDDGSGAKLEAQQTLGLTVMSLFKALDLKAKRARKDV